MRAVGRSGYLWMSVHYEIPPDMTQEQVCACIRDYLLAKTGKDNTLVSEQYFTDDMEGCMRQVNFWAIAYADLIERRFPIPMWAGWAERDKLIRELLEEE